MLKHGEYSLVRYELQLPRVVVNWMEWKDIYMWNGEGGNDVKNKMGNKLVINQKKRWTYSSMTR